MGYKINLLTCLLSGWLKFYIYPTESNGTFTEYFIVTIQGPVWMEKQPIPPENFALNWENGFILIFATGSLTDATGEMGSKNMGFITMPNFPWNNDLH